MTRLNHQNGNAGTATSVMSVNN